MKLRLLALLVGLAALPAFLAAQENPIGQVRAFLVKGDVTLRNDLTGASAPLRRGDTFTKGYTVITKADSNALLLFSNGSSIQVRPNSLLTIQEFSQEAYRGNGSSGDQAFTSITGDPSTSNTVLRLHVGEIAGEVKSLTPNSSFAINTPNGSAGIRGTVFVISVQPDGRGGFRTYISNISGSVNYHAAGSDSGSDVPQGRTVELGNDPSDTEETDNPVEHQNAANELNQAQNEAGVPPSSDVETPADEDRSESQRRAEEQSQGTQDDQVRVDPDIVSPN